MNDPEGFQRATTAFYLSIIYDQPYSPTYGKTGNHTLASLAYQMDHTGDGIYWQGVQTYLTKLAGKK